MKKVVLAGGTGFIGDYFKQRFEEMGCDIRIISRQPGYIHWEDFAGIVEVLEGADLLVNLAGKSVNCRYHPRNQNEIMVSRVMTTHVLSKALAACAHPPEVWMNSSTATIYRHAEDRPMTEEAGEIGSGFSVNVASTWEDHFYAHTIPGVRKVALRTAIVLGKEGGVMGPYKNLVKFGLGGVQGSGDQMFSWIHVEDLFRIVLFLKGRPDLSGSFNCSAPEPVTNAQFMEMMRVQMGRTYGLSASKWMLELGSVFIRTETELVLKSRWVVPDRLEKAGYSFEYPAINEALSEILQMSS
ncbi:TIGR01777 family protein [Halobacillus halophilus]|uniref:TIGR01777 family oxidoreductase n=1 Tax=Halobacillus halophilus TaxID=1570 RepID=UPI00136B2B51|nr:TIGR01777 family oxidoreductase [Halobacillus halophilus]MYL28689.1 TIGR01777 family protein [Halobacillus halophilus]